MSIVVLIIFILFQCSVAIAMEDFDLSNYTLDELNELEKQIQKRKRELQSSDEPTDSLGKWYLRNYVDTFGERTNEKYITLPDITGTFSNSAVTNEELLVSWIIDEQYVCFKLYEYGKNLVKGYSRSSRDYKGTLRDANSKDQTIFGEIFSGGDRLVFEGASADKIKKALALNGKTQFYIVDRDHPTTTYRFTIQDSTGFGNAWKKLTGNDDYGNKTEVSDSREPIISIDNPAIMHVYYRTQEGMLIWMDAYDFLPGQTRIIAPDISIIQKLNYTTDYVEHEVVCDEFGVYPSSVVFNCWKMTE